MGAGGALTGVDPELCLWEAFVAPDVQHLHGINGKDSNVKPKDVLSFNQGYTAIVHQTQNHTSEHPAPKQPNPTTKLTYTTSPSLMLNQSHSIPNQIPKGSVSNPASVCPEPAIPNVKSQFSLH